MPMEIIIQPSGNGRCIYGETIDLGSLGALVIRRGSFVEPTADGRWTVDLSPVGGPTLGPLHHRSEALAREVSWLREYWLVPPGG